MRHLALVLILSFASLSFAQQRGTNLSGQQAQAVASQVQKEAETKGVGSEATTGAGLWDTDNMRVSQSQNFRWVCDMPGVFTTEPVTVPGAPDQCKDPRQYTGVKPSHQQELLVANGIVSSLDSLCTVQKQLAQDECYVTETMSIVKARKVYDSYTTVTVTDKKEGKSGGNSAGGVFSSCTDNPFSLCSGPRPGKKNPLRACFDSLC